MKARGKHSALLAEGSNDLPEWNRHQLVAGGAGQLFELTIHALAKWSLRTREKLDGNQALKVDWNGAQGKKFVQDIYEAAYKLLGGAP